MLLPLNHRKKLENYLKHEKYSYPEVYEHSPDILLFVFDFEGLIVKIRGKYDQLFGVEYKQLVGKKYSDILYKEDIEKARAYRMKALKNEPQYFEARIVNHDGQLINIDISLVPIKYEGNEIIGFYALTSNINEKVELRNFIEEKDKKVNSLIHHAHEIIGIIDKKGIITIENPSIEEKLGYKVEEISNKNFIEFIHPADLKLYNDKLREIIDRPNTPFTIELRIKHKHGDWRNFEVICTNLLNDPGVNGVVCNLLDTTEIIQQQLEIQRMAYSDDQTGLPNLRAFEKRIDELIQENKSMNRKYAIIHLNLDGYRFLIDLIGRDIANQLLVKMASKINNKLGSSITLLARINDDDFALLSEEILEVD